MENKTGILYVTATPIGNLEDITLRAIRILKEVNLIACEDTRVTKKLLDRYEIKTPTVSYHQHSKLSKIDWIVEQLKAGKNVALATDAGTPGVSDPGGVLVAEAVKNNIKVEVVPGASALSAMISLSGINMQRFLFVSFSPKKGKGGFFKAIAESEYPVIYYESPHRLVKNLEMLAEIIEQNPKQFCEGQNCRAKNVIIGRELTKMFEETFRGSISEAIKYFGAKSVKGELVVIVY